MLGLGVRRILFASRWLLVPFYLALLVALVALLITAIREMLDFLPVVFYSPPPYSYMVLRVLTLIDLAFIGALVVIVIFSGYKNFVSTVSTGERTDWPEWMGRIDFTGLKLKLMSSIVAISSIQLLKNFMDVSEYSDRQMMWMVGLHIIFVITGPLLALTERLSGDHHNGN
ncbi:TIGR00645 family protein [Pseudochelatococcus sp. B33]